MVSKMKLINTVLIIIILHKWWYKRVFFGLLILVKYDEDNCSGGHRGAFPNSHIPLPGQICI